MSAILLLDSLFSLGCLVRLLTEPHARQAGIHTLNRRSNMLRPRWFACGGASGVFDASITIMATACPISPSQYIGATFVEVGDVKQGVPQPIPHESRRTCRRRCSDGFSSLLSFSTGHGFSTKTGFHSRDRESSAACSAKLSVNKNSLNWAFWTEIFQLAFAEV